MKNLLNTLFVTTEDAYLTLDGDNIVVKEQQKEIGRFPLHILENIYSFSYAGASPSLIGSCAERGIGLCFYTPTGKYLGRVTGENNGNVLLRRQQYRVADNENQSLEIAVNMIFGKVYNSRWTIERTIRDYPMRVDVEKLSTVSHHLQETLSKIKLATTMDELRGTEGEAAEAYFSVFNNLIINQKEDFQFQGRNRRPPLDKMNAALSFAYTLLKNECSSGLAAAGLDSYVGFMHSDRSGRESLALDIMEELRSIMADRFVLTLVNQSRLKVDQFVCEENGAVFLNDSGRKVMIKSWQERGKEMLTHPYLNEKIPWGLIPSIQALLLARYLRNDLDGYPPFLWK